MPTLDPKDVELEGHPKHIQVDCGEDHHLILRRLKLILKLLESRQVPIPLCQHGVGVSQEPRDRVRINVLLIHLKGLLQVLAALIALEVRLKVIYTVFSSYLSLNHPYKNIRVVIVSVG